MIRGHLGDLIAMPPLPDDARQPVAEMLITDNATGRTTEKEVTDHA